MKQHTWRLPDGIDEVLPPDAWALERLRRRVLDLFVAWGYQYVDPPLDRISGLVCWSDRATISNCRRSGWWTSAAAGCSAFVRT